MRTNIVSEMSWVEFDQRRKETNTVILPSGATEVYGPHLPMGSDILVSRKIAQLVAEQTGALVGPSLEVGQSYDLNTFPGTIATRGAHLKAVYRDICESFIKWGFRNIFIVNSHVANTQPLNELMDELRQEYGVNGGLIAFWQYIPGLTQDLWETDTPHGHASEAGTSVLLHLFPELVDMSKAVNSPALIEDPYPRITVYTDFIEYTKTGTLGDATKGTAEKGAETVRRAVDEISAFISECMISKKQ